MISEHDKQRRMHYDLANVGLRAQASAAGLVQVCLELKRANVLDEEAFTRIKVAIADEVCVSAPRSMTTQEYRASILGRLDKLFHGHRSVTLAEVLAPVPAGSEPAH